MGLWKAGSWEGTPAEVPCCACAELLPQEGSRACLGSRGGAEHSGLLWPSGHWSCWMVSLLSGEGPNITAPCWPLCLGQAVGPGLALQRVGRG